MDLKKFDSEMREYFNSLPPLIQEDLMQSDAAVNGKDDLQRLAEQMMQQQ